MKAKLASTGPSFFASQIPEPPLQSLECSNRGKHLFSSIKIVFHIPFLSWEEFPLLLKITVEWFSCRSDFQRFGDLVIAQGIYKRKSLQDSDENGQKSSCDRYVLVWFVLRFWGMMLRRKGWKQPEMSWPNFPGWYRGIVLNPAKKKYLLQVVGFCTWLVINHGQRLKSHL